MGVEEEQHREVKPLISDPPTRHPSFVEVICESSGKTRRFAAGTTAAFAVTVINNKLEGGPRVWHIEATKEGQEPITFGPNCVLLEYGDGWRLHTVFEPEALRKKGGLFTSTTPGPPPTVLKDFNISPSTKPTDLQSNISYPYIAKILLAFVLIFLMGAGFTFVLENLPRLILYINSL